MSLESNLELNNQLLTQQNSLCERNNALLEKLVQSLVSGAAAVQTAAVAQVQEYRETVPENKAENTVIRRITLDDLEFGDVVAFAGFNPLPVAPTADMFQQVIAYRDATGTDREEQIDALDSALRGVKRAEHLNKPALLDLSRHILRYWDELPTIGERRDFAERLLDAPAAGRDSVKPKKAGSDKTQERKGPFYIKNANGTAASELHTVRKLDEMLKKGHIEINKVEYLQLQEKFKAEDAAAAPKTDTEDKVFDTPDFAALRKQAEGLILQLAKGGYRAEAVAILEKHGAQKLGGVADEDLAEVIAQAEKALEG